LIDEDRRMATERLAVYLRNLGVDPRVPLRELPKEEASAWNPELQAYAAEAGLRRSQVLDTSALQRVRARDDALVLPPGRSGAASREVPPVRTLAPTPELTPGRSRATGAPRTADESWWKLEFSAMLTGETGTGIDRHDASSYCSLSK
jgi:hypothetical protein